MDGMDIIIFDIPMYVLLWKYTWNACSITIEKNLHADIHICFRTFPHRSVHIMVRQ